MSAEPEEPVRLGAGPPPETPDEYFAALSAIVGRTPEDVRRDLAERERDLQGRLYGGVVGEMVRKAAEIEPLVAHTWAQLEGGRFFPFHSEPRIEQMVTMHRLQQHARRRRARSVVVIPDGRLGGVARTASHLTAALAELHGPEHVVVIRADRQDLRFRHWFPPGVRLINFAKEAGAIKTERRQRLLVEFLRSLRPESIFNVNSRLLWEATGSYGRALSASSDLYAYLFPNVLAPEGHLSGPAVRNFYRYFHLLRGMFTDSEFLARELRTGFQLPPQWRERLTVLPAPAPRLPEPPPAPEPSPGRRSQVFWAGSFDRHRRLDVVLELARRLPEADFRLWGEFPSGAAVSEEPTPEQALLAAAPPNLTLEGAYDAFSDLPLEECDLWLYTSTADGVPNLLLEIAATGIPLVCSVTGGSEEVVPEGRAERVASLDDVDGFEAAIRRTLDDSAAARERGARLRQETLARRTADAYREALQGAVSARMRA